ncbi:MAG: replication protein P [Pseudohongiellaceae bacterium]
MHGQSSALAEPERGYRREGHDGRDEGDDTRKPDHVDAVNQVFAEFELAYHNQYHKAFPDGESVVIAKKYWLSSLERYSPPQIIRAARRLVKTSEYLPAVAGLVKACESSLDLFGLPSSRQAYIEACQASSPKAEYRWSHPAVYYAGRASDWYVLANEPEARAFPVFDYHYRQLCGRVMEGERLDIEQPRALQKNPARHLSPAERRERMEKLRRDHGI